MKRSALLRHLRKHGCFLKREGKEHSLWCSPLTGRVEAIPRHVEIPNNLITLRGKSAARLACLSLAKGSDWWPTAFGWP